MNFLWIPFIGLFFLSGCATSAPFDQSLAARDMAVVKNTVYQKKAAWLIAVGGKPSGSTVSEQQVPAGNSMMIVGCRYDLDRDEIEHFDTRLPPLIDRPVPLTYTGKVTLKSELNPGHTYQLRALLPRWDAESCDVILVDITKH